MDCQQWIHSIRVTGLQLDETNPGYPGLYFDPCALDNHMHWLSEQGFNAVLLGSAHFRLCYIDKWDAIMERVKLAVDTAHEYGIKLFEHHSASIVLDRYASRIVNGHQLRDMSTQSIRADGPVWVSFGSSAYERMMCPNNPHYLEFYLDYVRRMITYTGVDGFMCDDVEFCPDETVCTCPYCRQKFREIYGIELPPISDDTFWFNLENPDYRKWLRFRQETVGDFHVVVKNLLREIAPHVQYMTCQASPTGTQMNVTWALPDEEVARATDILFIEVYDAGRRSHRQLWDPLLLQYHVIRAMSREYDQPVISLSYCSAGDETYYALAMMNAMGLRPWFAADWRQKDMLQFEAKHADLFEKTDTLANIAVLWSRNTRDFFHSTTDEAYVTQVENWVATLGERNIPFHVVTESAFDTEIKKGYKVLLLPEAACLSDDLCESIKAFMAGGGTVVATNSAFLRDETGQKRLERPFSEALDGARDGELVTKQYEDGRLHFFATRPSEMPVEVTAQWVKIVLDSVGDSLPFVIRGAPAGLSATLAKTEDGRRVLHLINKNWKEDRLELLQDSVHITFSEGLNSACMRSPEYDREITIPVRENTLEIPVQDMHMYSTVELS